MNIKEQNEPLTDDMHKHWNVIWILLAVAAALASCSDSPDVPDGPEQPEAVKENVYVRLRIDMGGSGVPGSRAELEEAPYEHSGSSREKVLTSMDILICDDVDETIYHFVPLAPVQIQKILNNETVGINVSVEGWAPVHLYALVNMPDAIRQLFVPGKKISDINYASAGSSYVDVINEYVAGSNGLQETLETGGTGSIPMTGQFVDSETGDANVILAKGTSEDSPLVLNADLSRIVAKVHLLVKWLTAGSAGVKYAYALDPKSASGVADGGQTVVDAKWLGWIRVDNVRYMPNGTNKSTYVLPHPSSTGGGASPEWDDMNMSLDPYITGSMDFNIDFDAQLWARDFVYYNGMDLHRENVSDNCALAKADCFDEETYGNTLNDRDGAYTRGMYCLENYFHEPDARGRFDTYEGSVPMITHLSVAAKLTPRWIVIRKDYYDRMNEFVNRYKYWDATMFNEEYGLSAGDFGLEDVMRWEEKIAVHYKEGLTGSSNYFRDNFRILQLDTEADAIDIINWSLMSSHLWSGNVNDFERGKFPPETFYCYDVKHDAHAGSEFGGVLWEQQYLYLTAGAIAVATDDDADIKTYSVPHPGGWGYYFTYFNDTDSPLVDGAVPYSASQVTRNKYYLTTIGNFGSPGGTITRPEYIKVNTVPVAWNYAGRGDVNLH